MEGDGEGVRDLIGRQIGNYVIRSMIGRGGMGEVFLAEHPRIGRKVAIKVLAQHIAGQPRVAQRFEAEARAISRLDHPNIVNLFDFGALDDGSLYYVMELLQGHELEQLCQTQGKFEAKEAYPYITQICRGLQTAHDRGVIHRDLKPQNIFVLDGPTVRIKILDFGIAKLLEGQQGVGATTTGMVMGTPLFISPEQAAGQSDKVGPHTDIYSLGVILYMMLCGELPFSGTTPVLLLAKHIETMPPHLREHDAAISPLLDNLVNRCLLKDPAQRPRSAAEVALRFAEAVGESPDPASFETVQDLTQPPELARTELRPTGPQPLSGTTLGSTAGEVVATGAVRPRRWPVAVAAVVLVGAVVGALGVWLLTRSPEPESSMDHRASGRAAAVGQAPASASTSAPTSAPAPPATGAARTLRVDTAGAAALCTLEPLKGDGGAQKMSSPCKFEVRDGQRLRLTVMAAGLNPFLKEWRVAGDLKLALAVNPATRQLALAEGLRGSAALAPDAGSKQLQSKSTRRVRRTVRRRPAQAPKQPAPEEASSKEATPKKATPKRPATIGEGTLEVDL